jgi:hypothetical protein
MNSQSGDDTALCYKGFDRPKQVQGAIGTRSTADAHGFRSAPHCVGVISSQLQRSDVEKGRQPRTEIPEHDAKPGSLSRRARSLTTLRRTAGRPMEAPLVVFPRSVMAIPSLTSVQQCVILETAGKWWTGGSLSLTHGNKAKPGPARAYGHWLLVISVSRRTGRSDDINLCLTRASPWLQCWWARDSALGRITIPADERKLPVHLLISVSAVLMKSNQTCWATSRFRATPRPSGSHFYRRQFW